MAGDEYEPLTTSHLPQNLMQSKRFFWLLFIFTAVLFAAVSPVFAHAVPEITTPAANAVLEESPPKIGIQFNEPVVPSLSRIDLLTQAGEQIEVGPLTAVDLDNRTLTVDVPPLEKGAYLVSWQALSTVDGHTTSGTFSFGFGAEPVAMSNDAIALVQISPFGVAARWLTITAVSLLMGIFAFRLIVWNPIVRRTELDPAEAMLDVRLGRLSVRIGLFAFGLLAVALLLTFIDQNQKFELITGNNLGIWFNTQFGLMWLYRFLLGGMMLFLLLLFIRVDDGREGLQGWTWWAGLILSLGLAISVAMVSHAAGLAENSFQAILVDFAHVMAATMWVGGLVFLALTLWLARSLADEERTWLYLSLILNFSGLAAIAVGILALSGMYLAWQHVGTWTKLVGTAYGLTLLLKLAVAGLTVFIAGINLWFIKPRLNAAYEHPEDPKSETAVRRFRYLVTIEVTIALFILLITGFLTDMQRGQDAPLLSDAPGETVLTQQVNDLMVEVTITPALVGSNAFEILITDADGRPAAGIEEVSARFTYLDQSLGSAGADAELMTPGLFRLDGNYISLIGDWQMELSLRQPGVYDTFAAFRLKAGVGGHIQSAENRARPLEEAAQFMTLTTTGGTGLLLLLFAIGWGIVAVKAAKNEWQLIPLLVISLIAFWLGASQLLNFFTVEYTPAKFANNPILPDVESIAIGQALYTENCVPCHGETGQGDGPTAASIYPPPADFTSGHTAIHPDGDLYYWILNGIPETKMPPFAEYISKEEAWHLVNYVRRLSAQGTAANPMN